MLRYVFNLLADFVQKWDSSTGSLQLQHGFLEPESTSVGSFGSPQASRTSQDSFRTKIKNFNFLMDFRIFKIFMIFSKNVESECKIGMVTESLRNEIWRNVWIPNSFGMEKTDFFWKKSFLSFLEDFWCQIVYGWVWSISRFLLYFRLMEVLQIYALNVPKIVNFLFFEKTTLNLHHISKWAKKLISGQIWAHLEFGRWKTPYYEFSM